RAQAGGFGGATPAATGGGSRRAAATGPAARGRGAKARFQARRDYYPFRLKPDSPVVRQALAAARVAGWEAKLRISNGGLDANWTGRDKIPTGTFGARQNNIHTTEGVVGLAHFTDSCRPALAPATPDG